MKKIILLITAFVCLVFVASCSHSHEKADKLASDATHHWYPCSDEECTAVLEKVEHTWGQGEVTTQPTPSKEGVRSYLCTVCQRLKQEGVKYTAYHTVDEAQWKKAFSSTSFTNVSATVEEIRYIEQREDKTVYTVQVDGSVLFVVRNDYQNGTEKSYSGIFQDGNFVYKLTDKSQVIQDVKYELTLTPVDGFSVVTGNGFDRFFDCYDSFSYNEETGCYEAHGLTFESGFGYVSVSVKMQDGRIAAITAITDENPSTEVNATYFDYGKTKPAPPTREEK